jgi:crossover junction endodeoxyribonuclease RuvC
VIVAGLDPGLSGALAIVDDGGVVTVDYLPTHQAQHGKAGKQRNELDLHALRLVLTEHRIGHVFLESVSARPGQGVVSMFRFGYAAGSLYGLVIGLALPVTLVRPQTWQKHHGIGPSPDAARQRAVQLYPAVAERLLKKRDSNRADAILVAAYGLQQRGALSRAA